MKFYDSRWMREKQRNAEREREMDRYKTGKILTVLFGHALRQSDEAWAKISLLAREQIVCRINILFIAL